MCNEYQLTEYPVLQIHLYLLQSILIRSLFGAITCNLHKNKSSDASGKILFGIVFLPGAVLGYGFE